MNWTAECDADVGVAYLSLYSTVQWAFTPPGFVNSSSSPAGRGAHIGTAGCVPSANRPRG